MARTRTSKAWMREHVNDPWVQRAKAEGWRSRAAFKLMEVDDKDKLIRRGGIVVDLGCTPGGWSQVARKRLGNTGRVIGLDLLPLDPLLPGVEFLQGDATKAKEKLGWTPKYDLNYLVKDMMESDLILMKKDTYLKQGGYKTLNYFE